MNAVTNNDALHAFFLLQDGEDPHADYAARRREAQRRGWMRHDASELPNAAAKVGWMATAGCVVMQVKGGLSMAVLGPTPRYATRELVYMEVLPLRTENQILSGGEFVDYINRLERLAGGKQVPRPGGPLEGPAGDTAPSPGNEGAIQEGPLPEQGPREAPVPDTPPTTQETSPGAQPPASPAAAQPVPAPPTAEPPVADPPTAAPPTADPTATPAPPAPPPTSAPPTAPPPAADPPAPVPPATVPPAPPEPPPPAPPAGAAEPKARSQAAAAGGVPALRLRSDRHAIFVANAMSERILDGIVAQSHRANPVGSGQERASA